MVVQLGQVPKGEERDKQRRERERERDKNRRERDKSRREKRGNIRKNERSDETRKNVYR